MEITYVSSCVFLRRCSLRHEELSLVFIVVNLRDISPVLRNGKSVQWPFDFLAWRLYSSVESH